MVTAMWPFTKRAKPQAVRRESPVWVQIIGSQMYRDAPRRNYAALLEAYNTLPMVRALVHKIARARASLDWTLAVATEKPGGAAAKSIRVRGLQRGERQQRKSVRDRLVKEARLREVESHPLLDFLDSGNTRLVGLQALFTTYVQEELTGEAYWLIERNAVGMPVMFWPLPPSAIKRTPTPGFDFYEVDFRDWRDNIPAADVIWFCEPDPVDPYGRGTSIVASLGDELETGEHAAKHIKSFFQNRARPELLIYGKDLNKDETDRLEEKWNTKYGNAFWRAYRAFFMRGEVQIKELSQNFDNMQLVELLQHLRDFDISVLGMPPEMMGVLSNANRSTIDNAEKFFGRWVIVPRQETTRATLQERLVPQFDPRLALDYQSPVAEDREFNLEVMKAKPEAFLADEWREKAGMEPLPNGQGKVHFVTYSTKVVESLDDLKTEAPPVAPVAPALPKPTPATEPGTPPAETPAPTAKGLRLVHSVHKAIRKEDIPRLLAVLDPQVLERVTVPILTEIMAAVGQATLEEANATVDFDLSDPLVVDYLRRQAGERIESLINETTRTQLGETLAQGFERGETTTALAARIADVFDEAAGARSFLIARTESTTASGFAAASSIRQAGFPTKSWLSIVDDRTRDTHKTLNGKTIPVDEHFVSDSGDKALHPGGFSTAAENCECRCLLVAGVSEKSVSEARQAHWHEVQAMLLPHERALRQAYAEGFAVQRAAVMAAFTALVADAA